MTVPFHWHLCLVCNKMWPCRVEGCDIELEHPEERVCEECRREEEDSFEPIRSKNDRNG